MKKKNKRSEGKPFRQSGLPLQGILLEKWKKAMARKQKKNMRDRRS